MAKQTSNKPFKDRTIRNIEIEQEISRGFSKDMVYQLFYDSKPSEEEPNGVVWCCIDKIAFIVHDKDKTSDFQKRDPHIHCMIKFKDPTPVKALLARMKKKFLEPKGRILFAESGAYDFMRDDLMVKYKLATVSSDNTELTPEKQFDFLLGGGEDALQSFKKIKGWSSAINYLTHRDCTETFKHKYEETDVIANFDWGEDAQQAHDLKGTLITRLRKKEIIDNISNGVWLERDLDKYVTPYERIQLKSTINESLDFYYEHAIKEDRHMDVIFIEGGGGLGKDHFAIEQVCKAKNRSYYRCNNSDNPFDNYHGEEVVVWSDARDGVFTPEKLFNLLDNRNNSRQKARFYDKALMCEILIITSSKPLKNWYKDAFEKNNEGRIQLYRRIKSHVIMKEDKVEIYMLEQDKLKDLEYLDELPYKLVTTMPNIFKTPDEPLTDEQMLEQANDLFGCAIDIANFGQEVVNKELEKKRAEIAEHKDNVQKIRQMTLNENTSQTTYGNLIRNKA